MSKVDGLSVIENHDDGGQAEPPSVLSMSSSRSRNRSSTSPPASAPARSPLSLSKSRDSPVTLDSDDDTHRPRRHSRIDADEPLEGPSAPTSSTRRKADNDDVSPAAARPFILSLTLQNTGSVARDHLASERTFLAYVRTSLAFASAGVALVQLFRVSVSTSANSPLQSGIAVESFARPLGATLIAFGIAVLVTGTLRYFAVQRALPKGLFPAARVSVFLQAISLGVLVCIVFGILVAVR